MKELLQRYLDGKYGGFIPTPLDGGYTNDTYLLNGTSPLIVAKVGGLFNKDLKNEVHSLEITKGLSIVPKIYDYMQKEDVQIVVMEYCEGTNGQAILDNNDLEKTKRLYRALGNSITNVHAIRINPGLNRVNYCNINEINLNLDFVPEHLIQSSRHILHKVTDDENNWVLTHGDFGIHNVLYTDEGSITILDWEWSEWANPLVDVAWVCWFTKLHYPDHADLLNSIFIDEYKTNTRTEISSEKLKTYCLYKVWKVLNKVTKAPKEVKQEWVRRLQWTIETNLI